MSPILFLAAVTWLFYAGNLTFRVLRREYTNQTKTMYLKDDAIETWDVPDLIFCTTNATRIRGSAPNGYNQIVRPLKGPAIPPGYDVNSPCDTSHDTMFVFWTDQGKIKINLNGTHDLIKVFDFESNSTVRGLICMDMHCARKSMHVVANKDKIFL
jgi:hypothetical protein